MLLAAARQSDFIEYLLKPEILADFANRDAQNARAHESSIQAAMPPNRHHAREVWAGMLLANQAAITAARDCITTVTVIVTSYDAVSSCR
jgi:hypothetical protein